MGKFNEIQQETTQSWGDNSFTTTVKENTVEFDSAKDKFTFKDAVEVPSLKVNGQPVGPAEPQQQADWNQNDNTKADYIKNRICSSVISGRAYSNKSEGYETVHVDTPAITELERYDLISLEDMLGRKGTISVGGLLNIDFSTDDYEDLGDGTYAFSEFVYLVQDSFATLGIETPGLYFVTVGEGLNVQYTLSAKEEVHRIDEKFIPAPSQLGGVQFKIVGSPATLQASIDGGSTWQTVTLS